eukprot:CAMPEP_0172167256 /NCGR_PEP_ID=MMETSP1050-20130122/9470_1 /TAXON_ID=233186 /ORGANISM="Cryptomonas curvata, Strain CCAP979/52" /LENGTH=238 /DNA_ID=CAMNT_0012838025 /DNA_START=43 /DNA_END=759 /DNA_ORIENTATION=+
MPSAEVPSMMIVEEGLVEDEMTQDRNERDDLFSQGISYVQKILFRNKDLRFESKDGDSWAETSTVFPSFHSRPNPLLPHSKPDVESIINRDNVFTGLNIELSQYPASPATGLGTAAHRAAYISPKAPQSPMAANLGYRPRTSGWIVNPGQFSPVPHPHAASQSTLSWSDATPSSPHAANLSPMRCTRAVRAGAGARRLHMPLRPAPAPACLTPTAARVFHAAAAAAAAAEAADTDSAV